MQAWIALGANLGEPLKALHEVITVIDACDGIEVTDVSRFYSTAPIESSGPDYTNAVIRVQTTLEPEALLQTLLAIEADFGRKRPAGIVNAPRTMDLDLLLYEGATSETAFLTLPHPRMHLRAFVLVPMMDIDPNQEVGQYGRVEELVKAVADQTIRVIG